MGVGRSQLLELKEVDRGRSSLSKVPQVKVQSRKKENQKAVLMMNEEMKDQVIHYRVE